MGGEPRGGPGEPGLAEAAGPAAGSVHMPRRQGKPAAFIYGRRGRDKAGGRKEKEPPAQGGREREGKGKGGMSAAAAPCYGKQGPELLCNI